MHILFLCEHCQGTDGWSRYTVSLGEALEERGHTIDYVTAKEEKEDERPLLPPPLRLLSRPFLAPFVARHLTMLLRRLQPDILHITVEPYALLLPFLGNWRSRTILTIHGSYGIRLLQFFRTRFLFLRALREIARIITVSAYTEQAVLRELQHLEREEITASLRERLRVIRNGIRLPPWSPGQTSWHPEKRLLHVGGVKPLKGVLEALEACAVYRERTRTPFFLSIIGRIPEGDQYVAAVERRMAELKLTDYGELRGIVSEDRLQQAYRGADLLLLPARTERNTFEGFGLVYLEANAHGVPCIGPRESGAAEAIAEGVSGYHVHPGDPTEIAERMHWILNEHRIARESCRQWAEEHSIEHVAQQLEEVYRELS
jgi:glycosyltransferase involved in cell wall biosynthesis